MKYKNYIITYHSVERLIERCPAIVKKYKSLNSWNRTNGFENIRNDLIDLVNNSEEDKSYINNIKKMIFWYEKYGYDKEYKILNNKELDLNLIFKKERKDANYVLVTIIYDYNKNHKNYKKDDEIKIKEPINKTIIKDYINSNTLSLIQKINAIENENNEIYDNQLKEILQLMQYNGLLNLKNEYRSEKNRYVLVYSGEKFKLSVNKLTPDDEIMMHKYYEKIKVIENNIDKSQLIKKNNKNELRKLKINEKEYEFNYNTEFNYIKINNVVDIANQSQIEISKPEKINLIQLSYNEKNIIERMTNLKNKFKVTLNNYEYEYTVENKKNLGLEVLVLKKNKVIHNLTLK